MLGLNLASSVYKYSRATPDAIAVVHGDSRLTYLQLAQFGTQIGRCLQRQGAHLRSHGAPPRIGIFGARSVDACIALLGACWAGATYVPFGTKLPEDRVLSILAQCELSAIIADAEGARLLTEKVLATGVPLIITPNAQALPAVPSGVTVVDYDSLVCGQSLEVAQPVEMQADDTAYIIFTSGTTGVPKGVMITTGGAKNYLTQTIALLGLNAEDRVLQSCELIFDVSVRNMFSTWMVGASLYLLPSTHVLNAARFVRSNALTVWNSVPSLIGMLNQLKILAPNSLPSLRLAVFSGEPLTRGTVQALWTAAPECIIYNFYGPTEVTVDCTFQQVTDPMPLTPGRDFIAIGLAIPGNDVAVLNEKGEIVADGVNGELAISGIQVAQGYIGAPELTAARFPTYHGKRWYLTGDMAMRDAAGVFHCLGRIDNQIKVLGHRVELEEVEAHLRSVTKAEVVGAVAWPIVDGAAQGIVGFVGAGAIDAISVIADLKTRMPAYMVPAKVIALEEMPTSPSGKVDRRALRALLEKSSV